MAVAGTLRGAGGTRPMAANGETARQDGVQWWRSDHALGACRRVSFTCTRCDGRGRSVTSPARPRMTSGRAARSPRLAR
ncbi:unnamed protein product [Parnassius apollo]|uniref:(apollo) hypothetical protein n=1 Tax=Parnassius apollo TaxID=110799 RepID=A0A8S3Y1Q5_PARAO|nr:unnamed protein product [Parnassius apollo]